MHSKLCVLVIMLLFGIVMADEEIDDNETIKYYGGIKIYDNERSCAMTGGICVNKSDCSYLTSRSGLCPNNQHLGVECCYELPVRSAPCSEHSGACMSHCNEKLQKPATDCINGDVCCVLVN